MKKTPSTIIGVKKAFTRNFQDHPVTFMLDATDNVWLFGQQVCPIIRYKHVYNTITRYCPLCRLLKPKEVKGFDIPIKVGNRGALIFPVADLPGLLAISKNTTFKEKGLAWVQGYMAQLTDEPATALPPARVEPPPSDERWFKEVATYEFEGMVFTGLMDDEKIPGFIAKEVTDELGKQDQGGSTRYIPEEYKGWSERQTPGGLQKVRVIDERGFYQLIMNAQKNPKVRRFQAWVYKEVLPAIRETGEYRPKPQVEAPQFDPHEMIKHPENLQRLLLESIAATQNAQILIAAKDEVIQKKERMIEHKDQVATTYRKQIISNQEEIRELKKYEERINSLIASGETYTVSETAKWLDFHPQAFHYFCGDPVLGEKFIFKRSEDKYNSNLPWLPMQWAIDAGLMKQKVYYKVGKGEKKRDRPQPRFTGEGVLAVDNRWKKNPNYTTPDGLVIKLERIKTKDEKRAEREAKKRGLQMPLFNNQGAYKGDWFEN